MYIYIHKNLYYVITDKYNMKYKNYYKIIINRVEKYFSYDLRKNYSEMIHCVTLIFYH